MLWKNYFLKGGEIALDNYFYRQKQSVKEKVKIQGKTNCLNHKYICEIRRQKVIKTTPFSFCTQLKEKTPPRNLIRVLLALLVLITLIVILALIGPEINIQHLIDVIARLLEIFISWGRERDGSGPALFIPLYYIPKRFSLSIFFLVCQ